MKEKLSQKKEFDPIGKCKKVTATLKWRDPGAWIGTIWLVSEPPFGVSEDVFSMFVERARQGKVELESIEFDWDD